MVENSTLLKCRALTGSEGSNPSASAKKESWQRWSMRWTENPENVVRVHKISLEMEIVVQLVECQIVALVVTGSNPVILPNCFGSLVG